MDYIRKVIGANIKMLCTIKNIRQKDLADALGVKPSAVTNWVTGKNSIDIETLYRLCEYLDVSLSEIFGTDKKGIHISNEAYRVAKVFDQADAHTKKIVNTALAIDEKKDPIKEDH